MQDSRDPPELKTKTSIKDLKWIFWWLGWFGDQGSWGNQVVGCSVWMVGRGGRFDLVFMVVLGVVW